MKTQNPNAKSIVETSGEQTASVLVVSCLMLLSGLLATLVGVVLATKKSVHSSSDGGPLSVNTRLQGQVGRSPKYYIEHFREAASWVEHRGQSCEQNVLWPKVASLNASVHV